MKTNFFMKYTQKMCIYFIGGIHIAGLSYMKSISIIDSKTQLLVRVM